MTQNGCVIKQHHIVLKICVSEVVYLFIGVIQNIHENEPQNIP